ncbi:RecBCD enzyme subunit RecC [Tepidimonas charontis]|uniref:RecBCD enzyme subunit RecC n=2 Tax=Tepidimonas charontis TaxID=2267262 RepID=A0A554XFJ4_9BURK|nr:RecBCD enzyme subunit RecC [Tepidimonas charontis]
MADGQRPGLMVVHGHRAEALLALALTWIRRWPQPPLAAETWIVPSQAVGLWVKQTQALQDEGIAAGLEMLLPAQWLWRAYRSVLGSDVVGECAPLDEGPLTWRLWRLLPTLTDPVYAPLQRYLRDDPDGRRRYQLARRLADLYDQYQVYRSDWLRDWAGGAPVLRGPDGRQTALAAADRWQAALWQRVLADWSSAAQPVHAQAEAPPTLPSRIDIHAAFVHAMRTAQTAPPGWPRRLTVFGLAALPPTTLEALALAARWTQVLVCVLNPCRAYWADLIPERLWLERAERHWRERAQRLGAARMEASLGAEALGHPLLAAWGRQGRDFIAWLQQYDERPLRDAFDAALRALGQRIDLFDCDDDGHRTGGPTTLLRQLQDDVLHNRTLAETQTQWAPVDPVHDASLRFHVCHTALREVEVLHDQIVAALHRDPSLHPRDIVVMAPDVGAYAPLIHAVFGRLGADDPRFVPYGIADADDAASAQRLALLRDLLDLPRQRLGVNTVLDWLQVPALARRFGFGPDDLALLRRWLADSGVRWGLDGQHRCALGAAAATDDTLTWTDGVRRLWLGMAMGPHEAGWRDAPPTPGVSPMAATLIERLQALLQTLQRHRQALSHPAPVRVWVQRLHGLLDDCLCADAQADAAEWHWLQRLRQALDAWAADAQTAGSEPMPLAAVADAWLARLGTARGAAQGYWRGGVTIATLLPMRAVPFRHVYLLGMHDGAYPRRPTTDDFDLMARHPRVGDRLARHEDLYLFLEALLSAREHLSISWIGRSAHDGSARAPCVLVAQLREHVAAGWRLAQADGAALLRALTFEHRLHPFDPAYFPPRPHPQQAPRHDQWTFSYAHEWAPRPAPSSPSAATLPPWQPEQPQSLSALQRFLRYPVRTLYEQRLDVRWYEHDETLEERDLAAPDERQRWRLNEQWLRAVVRAARRGQPVDEALAAAQRVWRHAAASGQWPLGTWGEAQAGAWDESARLAWQRAAAYWQQLDGRTAQRDRLDWRCDDPRMPLHVADLVGEVRRDAAGHRHRLLWQGHTLLDGEAGAQGQRPPWRLDQALSAWVTHLAHHLAGGPLYTWVLSPRGCAVLQPLETHTAQAAWQAIIDLWWQGMHQPIPFEPACALAWFDQQHKRSRSAEAAWDAACARYEGSPHRPGRRDRDALLRRCFPNFADLAGPRAQAADSALGQWAARLYGPLYAALGSALPPSVALTDIANTSEP